MTKKNTSYRASAIKRYRRTKAEVEQLDRQILEMLQQNHPQSVRHVLYRMTDPHLPCPVEKFDKGYRDVQNRCAELRLSGQMSYVWIADLSRRGCFTNTFADASDFARRMAGMYRDDLWRHADVQCEVWCESRSIGSVIHRQCEAPPPYFNCVLC